MSMSLKERLERYPIDNFFIELKRCWEIAVEHISSSENDVILSLPTQAQQFVVGLLGTKSWHTYAAIHRLCSSGFGLSARDNIRSLYETQVTVNYLVENSGAAINCAAYTINNAPDREEMLEDHEWASDIYHQVFLSGPEVISRDKSWNRPSWKKMTKYLDKHNQVPSGCTSQTALHDIVYPWLCSCVHPDVSRSAEYILKTSVFRK